VIGVDGNSDGMRQMAWRASRKPARGGLPNLLFGRLSLADAPGELVCLADMLTVLLPWGSLLQAVAVPELDALRRLQACARAGARARFLFGYGAGPEAAAVKKLRLPALGTEPGLSHLEQAYALAGFRVRGRYLAPEAIRRVASTWAKKLAFSAGKRVFVELLGEVEATDDRMSGE
jgi:16S rRNA (adenine(1408)-N(1))-methyltransferase